MDSTAAASDLRDGLDVLRRRAWMVLLTVVVGALAGFLIARASTPQDQSTAVLLFRPLQLATQVSGFPVEVGAGDAGYDVTTEVGLVGSQEVRDRVAARLGHGVTPSYLQSHLTVSEQGQSDLIDVTGQASTVAQAQAIAQTTATQFEAVRNGQITAQITDAVARLTNLQHHSHGLSLPVRDADALEVQKLKALAAVGAPEVQLSQPALPPTSLARRHTALAVVIGVIVGLLLGLAGAFGVEAVDRRLRRPEQMAAAAGLPLLAAVPRARGRRADAASLEAFRRLRANLARLPGGRPRAVLVTSGSAGTGKTTVALNLATAAAATGNRVSLVEADLRRPQLSRLMAAPADAGIIAVLDQAAPESVVPWTYLRRDGAESENGGGGGLRVLTAEATRDDASELIDSRSMRDLIAQAMRESDFLIVDAPPLSLVADAIPLAAQVDGVIVVGRLGRDTQQDLEAITNELRSIGARPIGVVATFAPRRRSPYDGGRRRWRRR